MRVLFWTSLGIVLYTYFGYPLYIWARSRVAPRQVRQGENCPTVSVVLAVRDGVKLIRQKIEHLLSLDYPADKIDIIVVSDGSSDGTNEILNSFNHPRVHIVICPEHGGKAVALNRGIQEASGEILLFVDIRPWLDQGAVRQLMTNFADPTVGCATGELILREANHDAGTRAVGGLYWRYEKWIRKCEARVDSPLGVYGGFYAVQRKLATEFPSGTILDDMYQPLAIIRRGYRSVIDDRARVIDTWPATAAGEFSRKVRTQAGNFQLLQLAPWLLTRENRLWMELISHKLLRLVVPWLLATLFVASFWLSSSPSYEAFLIIQSIFYLAALLGWIWHPPVLKSLTGPTSAFLLLNAATVVGLFRFIKYGREIWSIWAPSPEAPRDPERSRSADAT
jgi:cellulose synthase/poly-beta-1,6-N-acetylglucosamine synthase-like glycosyltransferase